MCGVDRTYASFRDTPNSFTDEGYADMEEYTTIPVEPATAHFDLTVEQMTIVGGALALIGELFLDAPKFELALRLKLLNDTALRTIFIQATPENVDDPSPWPPTSDDVQRVIRATGELGLVFTDAIMSQLGIA